MSYSPVDSDAPNVAGYTITRLNATSPSTGAAANDQATAIADSYLGAFGYQAPQRNLTLSTQTTTSTSYVDLTGTATTFSAPIAKVYLVMVQIKPYMTGAQDGINFQLVVNGSAVANAASNNAMGQFIITAQLVAYQAYNFMVPALMVAGTNNLKLQWELQFGNASAVAKVDSGSACIYTFMG